MGIIETSKLLVKEADQFLTSKGHENFCDFAANLLGSSMLHQDFNFEEVVVGSLSHLYPAHQNFNFLEFSDFPLTIAKGESCFLDMYIWRRRPTVIHNHHFSGAFMCLYGNNVDLEFIFEKTRKLGNFHDLGILKLEKERIIRPGDIAPIGFLNKYIHQNHHQSDLTVNICFRSLDIEGSSLSNYLYSGLRFEKDPQLLKRTLRMRKMLELGYTPRLFHSGLGN